MHEDRRTERSKYLRTEGSYERKETRDKGENNAVPAKWTFYVKCLPDNGAIYLIVSVIYLATVKHK